MLLISILRCVNTTRVLPFLFFVGTRTYVYWSFPFSVAHRVLTLFMHLLTLLATETGFRLIIFMWIQVGFVVIYLRVTAFSRLILPIHTEIAKQTSLGSTISGRVVFKLNVLFLFSLLNPLLPVDSRKLNVSFSLSYDKQWDHPVSLVLVPYSFLSKLVQVRVLQHHVDHCVTEFKILLLESDYIQQFLLAIISLRSLILELPLHLFKLSLQLLYLLFKLHNLISIYFTLIR